MTQPRIEVVRQFDRCPLHVCQHTSSGHVLLEPGDDPIGRRCAVNLDSVESVSVVVLTERIGALSGSRMIDICAALDVATDFT